MSRNILRGFAVCLAALAVVDSAVADVQFSFNYVDINVGFNDPTHGPARRAALADAAGRVGACFINYDATIDIDVNGGSTDDDMLASAGTNWNAAFPGNGFGSQGDVMIKILGGADPAPGVADGEINWNFQDHTWALGDTIGAGQLDFISTAMHEITHALGFMATPAEDGSSIWGDDAGTPSAWTPMDEWLVDAAGDFIIDNDYSLNSTRWEDAKDGGSSLFFAGPNAYAAYGACVPLYAPTTWEEGSSGGSHLDDATFLAPNFKLMNAVAQSAGKLDAREYSDIELGILADIGYTNIVPEPATLSLLVFGGMVALRRRRKA